MKQVADEFAVGSRTKLVLPAQNADQEQPTRSPSLGSFCRLWFCFLWVFVALLSGNPLRADTIPETHTFGWTALDRLATATGPEGTLTFSYDGDGMRLSKENDAGEKIVYIRDAVGNVIAEYDGRGALLAEYVYVGGRRLCRIAADGSRRYYHSDVVGSPQVITDEAGVAVWRGESTPFGEARTSIGEQDGYRFTGKEFDSETGLHDFGARYYAASEGIFTSVDPVAGSPHRPQTWSRYSYSLNNPLRFIDPDGRRPRPVESSRPVYPRFQRPAQNSIPSSRKNEMPFVLTMGMAPDPMPGPLFDKVKFQFGRLEGEVAAGIAFGGRVEFDLVNRSIFNVAVFQEAAASYAAAVNDDFDVSQAEFEFTPGNYIVGVSGVPVETEFVCCFSLDLNPFGDLSISGGFDESLQLDARTAIGGVSSGVRQTYEGLLGLLDRVYSRIVVPGAGSQGDPP